MTLHHATCVDFNGKGVVILGPSDSGKSDLALRLIDHGATLISDDYVEIKCEKGQLIAHCVPNIEGLIEVRGVGLIKMDYLKYTTLHLALELIHRDKIERLPVDKIFDQEGCQIPLLEFDAFSVSAVAKIRVALK